MLRPDSRPMPRAARPFVVAALLGLPPLVACKPDGEPMRRVAAAELEGAAPDAVPMPPPPTDDDFKVELPAPPSVPPVERAPSTPDAATPPEPAPEDGVDADFRALLRPVSEDDEERARTLNASGLRAHRRRDYDKAIEAYESALEAWPAHILARYNLACAESLRGSPERAIDALRTLASLGDAGVDLRSSLDKARVDEDFRALRGHEEFRTLTGYSDIILAFAGGDPGAEDAARRGLQALADAHHAARLMMLDADTVAEGVELQALASDKVAAASAPRLSVITGATRTRLVDRTPGGEAHVVVTFRSRATDAGEVPPEPPRAGGPATATDTAPTATGIEDLFGVRLTAREESRTHQLLLKATGFFEWTITDGDGAVERRTGRYRTTGDLLSLTFRAVRNGRDGGTPTTETTEGLSAEHPVRVEGGALRVGELEFGR